MVHGTPRVTVSQVNDAAVKLYAAVFGGNIREQKPRTPSQRPLSRWQVSGWRAVNTLASLLPFLKEKREQARLAIKWYSARKADRAAIAAEIKRLKWEG